MEKCNDANEHEIMIKHADGETSYISYEVTEDGQVWIKENVGKLSDKSLESIREYLTDIYALATSYYMNKGSKIDMFYTEKDCFFTGFIDETMFLEMPEVNTPVTHKLVIKHLDGQTSEFLFQMKDNSINFISISGPMYDITFKEAIRYLMHIWIAYTGCKEKLSFENNISLIRTTDTNYFFTGYIDEKELSLYADIKTYNDPEFDDNNEKNIELENIWSQYGQEIIDKINADIAASLPNIASSNENPGHFGLNQGDYSQFTHTIRRREDQPRQFSIKPVKPTDKK